MRVNEAPHGLDPKDEQLISALLRCDTRAEAARAAGVSQATLYRRLNDPDFRAALRAARRAVFDEALCVLEKSALKAVQALVDALDVTKVQKETVVVIMAATRLLDRAFKAQTSIAVEEELAELRMLLAKIKAGEPPAAIGGSPWSEEIRIVCDEQAEAARLRVAWMTEIGMNGHDIEASLRHNRPQTVEEEQYLLDAVRKTLEFEAMHEEFLKEQAA